MVIASDQTNLPIRLLTLTDVVTAVSATAANLKAQVSGADSDNAANSTTKLPVITGRANAAAPAWTEGNEVPDSMDLAGFKRVVERAVLYATTISAANAAVTLTIAAAGAGLFHYLTSVEIININPTATAIAGSAVTLAYTSTNITGAPAWTAGNALAAGAEKVVERIVWGMGGIKTTTANTATTIVAPAIGAGGLCRITVTYYIAA